MDQGALVSAGFQRSDYTSTMATPQSELRETPSLSLDSAELEVTVESICTGSNRPKECDDVVCCIRVPNCLLQSWWRTATHDTSYIKLVNDNIRGKTITLDTNCERLETHLHRRASEVARRSAKTKPSRARQQYLAKSTTFDVRQGETLQASLLLEELEMVNEDIEDWIERCEGSREIIALLREQLASATTSSTSDTSTSSSSLAPASTTSGILCQLRNTGRPLHQVGERQRRRKVSELKKSVQYVLSSFVDSFGLTLENVTMSDSAGSPLALSYQSSHGRRNRGGHRGQGPPYF